MREVHFLLSPARCDGRRAAMLMNPAATFALAQRLQSQAGVPLGEAFTFMSGLYFRGKLAYARAFARGSGAAVHVITPGRGLVDPDAPVRAEDLLAMRAVGVSSDEPLFRAPLERDAEALAGRLGGSEDLVVLLGSVATDKYVDALQSRLGERLRFPREFVGRGDMSRGGLMLRCVSDRRELEYIPVAGAIRRGPRPPKLPPLTRARVGSSA